MPDAAPQLRRPLRILYAAGPGDVVGTYRHWKEGRDDPSQVAVTYSGQFYDLCRDLGAEGYVISYCPRPDRLRDGPFRVLHRRVPFMRAPGPLYHLGQMWSGLRLTATAVRFRADVVVVMSGMTWWSLSLLPLFGTKVVPTLHAQLWRVNTPQRGLNRLVWWLNRAFFRRTASAVIYISDSVLTQLEGLTGPLEVPVLYFVPTYREGAFRRGDEARPREAPPFRVMYAGRVERDKGVFDLLDVAARFHAAGRADIEFDLCGDGSALDELRRRAERAGVSARFRCHGHMDKAGMRRMYGDAHAVVVPTTTASVEGLNKVVIESVLAGRPVITSTICPAIEYVRGACVEVPPDDVRAYGDAILRLADDKDFYEQKRQNCAAAGSQFYDPVRGWGATFRRVLELIGVIPADAAGPARARPAAPAPGPAAIPS
jgi:glycosyltransferase involved in cell wall biosynthesis